MTSRVREREETDDSEPWELGRQMNSGPTKREERGRRWVRELTRELKV